MGHRVGTKSSPLCPGPEVTLASPQGPGSPRWRSRGCTAVAQPKAVVGRQSRITPGHVRKRTPPEAGHRRRKGAAGCSSRGTHGLAGHGYGARHCEAEVGLGSEQARIGRVTVKWQLLGNMVPLGVDHSRVQPAAFVRLQGPQNPIPAAWHACHG